MQEKYPKPEYVKITSDKQAQKLFKKILQSG